VQIEASLARTFVETPQILSAAVPPTAISRAALRRNKEVECLHLPVWANVGTPFFLLLHIVAVHPLAPYQTNYKETI